MSDIDAPAAPFECERCLKPQSLCVCNVIQPVKTRRRVVILQHPQEPDKLLGSARLAHLSLPNSDLKIGLSWRNLNQAIGFEADPKRWAVLYLGSVKPMKDILSLVDKKGSQIPNDRAVKERLQGIILLDGTWSQAKTLWWRNAWLLKLQRAVLTPPSKSLYANLRKEPRRECLSTIEAAALVLQELEGDKKIGERLLAPFKELLARAGSSRTRRG